MNANVPPITCVPTISRSEMRFDEHEIAEQDGRHRGMRSVTSMALVAPERCWSVA
jgi:hypothetical protein